MNISEYIPKGGWTKARKLEAVKEKLFVVFGISVLLFAYSFFGCLEIGF